MKDQRAQFIQALQDDEELLTMLASNEPFWNSSLEDAAKFSIIPVDKITDKTKTPFISIQVSNDSLIATKLTDAFIYVRCYNESDRTFITIDSVLSRVKAILHNHRFKQFADNTVSIDTVYETTGADLKDDAYGLNYRESRYRVQYL